MKTHLWSKAGYSILIGAALALAPLAAAQAADGKDRVDQNRYDRESSAKPQSATPPAATPSPLDRGKAGAKGAQGPIRKDMGGDEKLAESGRDPVSRDIQKGLYPMANGVGIP